MKYLLTLLFIYSCDFTPPLNKKILEAQELIREHQYNEAIASYKKILKENPPDEIKVKIHYQVGDLYSIYLTKIEESFTHYQEVYTNSKDKDWRLKALERLADLSYSHIKKFDSAIIYFEQLLRETAIKSKIDFYEFRIAQSYFKLSNFDLALQRFNGIKNNDKHTYYARTLYYIGMIHFYMNDWDRAIKNLDKYVGLEKNRDERVQAKFILANALESRENLVAAYDLYTSILGEYPNTEVVKSKLESIYKRRVSRKRN